LLATTLKIIGLKKSLSRIILHCHNLSILNNGALWGMLRFITLFCAKVDKLSAELYNGYMSIDEMTLREEIARAIEALPIETAVTNAVGMRISAAKVARGESNYMTSMFESQLDFE
jgi:hypothetical protein